LKWGRNAIENGGDSIRIEWNSIKMGEFVSNVVEILSELPKALSNPLKTLSEWGCVASGWPGLRAVVSAWGGRLHGSVLRLVGRTVKRMVMKKGDLRFLRSQSIERC